MLVAGDLVDPADDLSQLGLLTPSGIFCSNAECSQPLSFASMSVQLDLACRNFITKFYEQWLVCDDSSCGNRTRMMSVYGKRCLAPACRGQMHFEASFLRSLAFLPHSR